MAFMMDTGKTSMLHPSANKSYLYLTIVE